MIAPQSDAQVRFGAASNDTEIAVGTERPAATPSHT
jgi:hypothetical protein